MKKARGEVELTEERFRGRLRGFSCENCGHIFREGEIVFHPNDQQDPDEIRGKWFCGGRCANKTITSQNHG
jgi:hypothetical protein